MNHKEVIYHVNGVAVSWWKRLASSKTFWIVTVFVLTAADRWNKGEITGTDFFQMVQIGVIGILIRAAMTKSELAANAGNPSIPTVKATEKTTTLPPEAKAIATCLVAAGATLALAACSGATAAAAGVI